MALLEAGRADERVPREVALRLWTPLAGQLPPQLPPATKPRSPQAGGAALAKLARTYTLRQVAALGLGLFGAGMAVGVATNELRRPPVEVAVVHPAPSLPPPAAPLPQLPSLLTPAPRPKATRASAPPRSPSRPPAARQPEPEPPSDASLAAERSLIAQARSALQRGAPTDALSALAAHARQFPEGRLEEEREALRVQALVALGDRPGAERAAAEFARNYPQSLMRPAVEAALRGGP
ncbi:MAG: hypothetical protein ACYCWW_20735 [Deltaproteobacteria bacterium]